MPEIRGTFHRRPGSGQVRRCRAQRPLAGRKRLRGPHSQGVNLDPRPERDDRHPDAGRRPLHAAGIEPEHVPSRRVRHEAETAMPESQELAGRRDDLARRREHPRAAAAPRTSTSSSTY